MILLYTFQLYFGRRALFDAYIDNSTYSTETIKEDNSATIKTESNNEKAYISLHDYYVTVNAYSDNNGKLDVQGNAFLKSRLIDTEYYDDTYAVVTFMTVPNVIHLNNQNNEFKHFFSDQNVIYCDGQYSEKNGVLNFSYDNAYLYNDSFNYMYDNPEDIYLDKLEIQDTYYDFDYYSHSLTETLNEVVNANKSGFMANVYTHECWFFDDIPNPFISTNIDGEYKWSVPLSQGGTCQVFTKGKYILTNQKGWSFDELTGTNEFVLQYSNSEILDDPDKVIALFRTGESIEDLKIENFKIQFHKDKTWDIISSYDDYEGERSGKWELIDNCILAIMGSEDITTIGNMDFIYLDFDKKQISLPLFVECNDMLKYIHMIDSLNQ